MPSAAESAESPVLRPEIRRTPVPSPTLDLRDLDVDVQDRADDLDGSFLGKRFNKERAGWYIFDWANSTFATLGMAMIVPVLLAGLAESYAYQGHVSAQCATPNYGVDFATGYPTAGEHQVLCRDPENPTQCTYTGKCQCSIDLNNDGEFMSPLPHMAPPGTPAEHIPNEPLFPGICHQCMLGAGPLEWNAPMAAQNDGIPWQRTGSSVTVPFLGFDVTPFSFSSLILSISVIAQAFVFIAVGPYADYGNYRKNLLMLFSTMGAISCGMFLMVSEPSLYWLAGIFAIFANVCFGASVVFYNAYLPLLADDHAEVKNSPEGPERESVREKVINAMSLNGFGAGYVAGFLVVLLAFPLVFNLPNDGASGRLGDRACMAMVCVWWLAFSSFTFKWLKNRSGPPLPGDNVCAKATLGFRRIGAVLMESRKYPNTFWFLVSFFFFSDGVSAVPSIGILFGQIYMCMGTAELLVVLTINVLFSAIGCVFFKWLGEKLQWNPKSMLLLVLSCIIGMITYMACGLFQPYFGLWNKWEIYAFGVAYGMLNGAWQSYSRVIWADMTIPGHEAEFFALFEITDRGSSWLTPFIVSVLKEATGNLRFGFFWVLAVTIFPAIAIKFGVDYEQGKIDVGRVAGPAGVKGKGYGKQKDSNSHDNLGDIKMDTLAAPPIANIEQSFPVGE